MLSANNPARLSHDLEMSSRFISFSQSFCIQTVRWGLPLTGRLPPRDGSGPPLVKDERDSGLVAGQFPVLIEARSPRVAERVCRKEDGSIGCQNVRVPSKPKRGEAVQAGLAPELRWTIEE